MASTRAAGMALVTLTLAAVMAAPAPAVPPVASKPPRAERIVKVSHAPVAPTSVQGSGLGAVRTFWLRFRVDGKARAHHYMAGTLTTVAVGMPGDEELRSSNLTFVFGAEPNQIVVGGVSLYPPAGATLAPGVRTVRPIIGGSGRYSGARGWVVTRNRGTKGWTHTFHLVG